MFSHKELNNKNSDEMKEMCFNEGVDWYDHFSPKLKYGRLIIKKKYQKNKVFRTKWISSDPPVFTQQRKMLSSLISKLI